MAVPLRCANPTEKITGLPMPIPGLRAIRALAQAVRASDAIIVHDALYLTSILAMIAAKLCGKPVALIQHIGGIAFASTGMRLLMRIANRLVTRPMLQAANRLIFISSEVRRELLGQHASRNSMLLFNGVDTSIFHPAPDLNRSLVRSKHGLPVNATVAMFVGRFVEKKGLSILEILARSRPDMHIALVGNGPIRPESWGLANVHVLGPQPQETIAELYAASDLLLLPSVGEGYPLVIQEAMACGLPVVCGEESARADPGATRWLRGVTIDPSDPLTSASRCSAAIDGLLADAPDRAQMANYAANAYSWPAMACAIVQSLSRPVEAVHAATGRYQPG